MSWRCNNCETVNSDTEKNCHVCGAVKADELHINAPTRSSMPKEPAKKRIDERSARETKIVEKPKVGSNLLLVILTLATVLLVFLFILFRNSDKTLSESDFEAACQWMPSYEAVLSNPSDYINDMVKVNLRIEQEFDNGDYRCREDGNGDFVYDGNEYYVVDRRGIGKSELHEIDTIIGYCEILGTANIERQSTGEKVNLVKLSLKYIASAPTATPTPKPTPTPTSSLEPTPTPWPTESLDIDGENVTAYIVDLRNYEWDKFSELSDSKEIVTKDTSTYPRLLKGAIENCYGIKIRRYSAEATLGDPFSVPYKGVVRLRNGKWSSGEKYNVFDYAEGTEVDVYVLFIQPTSFSAVDIIPTKGQKRECSWSKIYYSPVLYFATIEDATRYINSIS